MGMRFGAWGVVSGLFRLFVSSFIRFLNIGIFGMMGLLHVLLEAVKVVAMHRCLGLGDGTCRHTSSVELAQCLALRQAFVPGTHVPFGYDSLIEHAALGIP
jgi:hypothetical protein